MIKLVATVSLLLAAGVAAGQTDVNSSSRVGGSRSTTSNSGGSASNFSGAPNSGSPNTRDNGLQRGSIFNRNSNTSTGKATPTPAAGQPGATGATTKAGAASTTSRTTRTTTSTTTTAKPAGGAASRGGGQAAASNTAQSTGQVKEVTKAFLEAIRTQKVDYDEQEMAESPGVLILNSRKYKPEKSKLERESSRRGSSPIAQPL